MSSDESKSELLQQLCRYADERGSTALDGVSIPDLLRAYYRHVAPEDMADQSERAAIAARVKYHLDREWHHILGDAA